MNMDNSRLFPRDLYGRIALFISSLFFVPIGFLGAYMFLVKARPRGIIERLLLSAAGNFLMALSLFFLCGFIWAVATPKWLENLLGTATRRLAFAMVVFVVPFAVLVGWALLNEF
jgi:hypothetical protein